MEIEIIRKDINDLLGRNEILFRVRYEGSGTASNDDVRRELSNMLDVDIQRIYLRRNRTKKGSMETFGEAHVYDSVEQAKYIEPKYIIRRASPETSEEREKDVETKGEKK